jgi:hypothetical protein
MVSAINYDPPLEPASGSMSGILARALDELAQHHRQPGVSGFSSFVEPVGGRVDQSDPSEPAS